MSHSRRLVFPSLPILEEVDARNYGSSRLNSSDKSQLLLVEARLSTLIPHGDPCYSLSSVVIDRNSIMGVYIQVTLKTSKLS